MMGSRNRMMGFKEFVESPDFARLQESKRGVPPVKPVSKPPVEPSVKPVSKPLVKPAVKRG